MQGEPVLGGLKAEARHFFCPDCMSWMFTAIPGLESFVNLRATMLDAPGWFAPFAEFCTEEKFAWAETSATHSFTGFPPAETFSTLIAEYAALGSYS